MRLIDIDKAIPELNNLSLREVFEGGNLLVNGDLIDSNNDNVPDDLLTVNSTNSYVNSYFQQNPNSSTIPTGFIIYKNVGNISSNQNLYLTAKHLGFNTNNHSFRLYNIDLSTIITTLNLVVTPVNLTWYQSSSIYNTVSNYTNFLIAFRSLSTTGLNDYTQLDNFYAINLTALGINLTKEQIDEYFAMYQSGLEASGFVQKMSKNLLTDWEQGNLSGNDELSDSQRIRTGFIPSLPSTTYTIRSQINSAYAVVAYDENKNFVTNYVSGIHSANTANTFTTSSTIRYLRLAIRKEPITTITPSDYVDFNVQLELGTTATTYTPYQPFALAKGAYLSFDGVNDYVNTNTAFNISSNDFKFEIEFKIDTSKTHTLFGNNNAQAGRYDINVQSNNKIRLFADQLGQRIFDTTGTIVTNQKTKFSIERIGSNLYFYLNDVLDTTFTGVTGQLDTTTTMFLGAMRNLVGFPERFLDGNIYSFSIYISNNLVLNYQFEKSLSNIIKDTSGNNNDGTISGATWGIDNDIQTVQAQAFIQTAGKDTRVIDAKLPYLNMMSIREVFESNLVVNIPPTINVSSVSTWLTYNNSTFIQSSNFQSSGSFALISGQKYYQRIDLDNSSITTNGFLGVRYSDNSFQWVDIGANKNASHLFIANASLSASYQTRSSNSVIGNFITNSMTFINLTALGLTHLTQAELDAMFALYQAGTLKLSDVFETGNLVTNGDFSDGTTGWSNINNTLTVNNGIGTVLATAQFGGPRQNINVNINDFHYVKVRYKPINNNHRVFIQHINNTVFTPTVFNQFIEYSIKGQVTQNVNDEIRFVDFSTSSFVSFNVDYYYSINLNTHNLQATTQTFMDDLFKAYQRYKGAFIDKQGVMYAPVFNTHAGVDTVFAALGNRSLREVFEVNNLISNPNFDNGLTGWVSINVGTPIVNNGIVTFTSTASTSGRIHNLISINTNNTIYYNALVKADSVDVKISTDGINQFAHSGSNNFELLSRVATITYSTNVQIQIRDFRTSAWTPIQVDYAYAINLTSLGLTSLTQAQLDFYFSLYQKYSQRGN